MMSRALIALFVSLLPTAARATEFAWVNISPRFGFKDFNQTCTNGLAAILFQVGVQIEGTTIATARLREVHGIWESTLELTPEEAARISFVAAADGRRYLTVIPATPPIVAWMMWRSTHASSPCQPTMALATVVPNQPDFHFDMSLVGTGLSLSVTQLLRIEGKLENGESYVAALKLEQDPF